MLRRWTRSDRARVPPRVGQARARTIDRFGACALTFCLASCGGGTQPAASASANLRVGIGYAPLQTPERGVQQFISLITNEGLVRVNQQGKLEPLLAERTESSADGLRLTVRLRANAKFHDGTPVTAPDVAAVLQKGLPTVLRSIYEDVASIDVKDAQTIEIVLHRPSPFVAESLVDLSIQKAGTPMLGTGPFIPGTRTASGTTPLSVNAQYYLNRPSIDHIDVTPYPNVRAAWADLLRNSLDMLYEVGADAIELTRGKSIKVYDFERPYQFLVILNSSVPKLKSPEVRRALNQAIDRPALIRDALSGQGVPSAGPVSAHHWAFGAPPATFQFEPAAAERVLRAATKGQRLRLVCLAPGLAPYERLTLLVKQQLSAVGVDLQIEDATPERIGQAFAARDYEALLVDVLSGWDMFRPYAWWHSTGTSNKGYASRAVDAALNQVRSAVNDNDYRGGVTAFQQAIADDPPAIFIAWGIRSRAVSTGFEVPTSAGTDIIATIYKWKPSADKRTSQN